MTEAMLPFIFNILLGIIMFFLKKSNDESREEIIRLRNDIDKIKDNTVKKEDFREFKEELWQRLDKMETDFKIQLNQLNKQ